MAVAEALSDVCPIFGFDQGVIVGVSSPGFGQFDKEFLEELDHMLIDVLEPLPVGVKAKQIINGNWSSSCSSTGIR